MQTISVAISKCVEALEPCKGARIFYEDSMDIDSHATRSVVEALTAAKAAMKGE